MGQPTLDHVLGVMQANETAHRESKQIRTKCGLMEYGRVDRVSGRKARKWRVGNIQYPCERCCGIGHRILTSSCPACGKTCNDCGRTNHFARACKDPQVLRRRKGGDQESSKILYTSDACISTDEISGGEDGLRAEGPSGRLGIIRMEW